MEVLRLAFLFLPPLAPLLVLDEEAAASAAAVFLAVAFFLEGDEDVEEVAVLAGGMVGAASGAGASGTKLLFLAADGCEAVGGLG